MNYIKTLEIENIRKDTRLALALHAIEDFRAHLNSAKFQGTDPVDGERKDWMSTTDVLRWLESVRDAVQGNY